MYVDSQDVKDINLSAKAKTHFLSHTEPHEACFLHLSLSENNLQLQYANYTYCQLKKHIKWKKEHWKEKINLWRCKCKTGPGAVSKSGWFTCGLLSVFKHVSNGYMAQLAVFISAPDLRQLIRSHVLKQTVKTVETKAQSSQITLPVQYWQHDCVQPQSIPDPPISKRSAVRQKAQLNKLGALRWQTGTHYHFRIPSSPWIEDCEQLEPEFHLIQFKAWTINRHMQGLRA